MPPCSMPPQHSRRTHMSNVKCSKKSFSSISIRFFKSVHFSIFDAISIILQTDHKSSGPNKFFQITRTPSISRQSNRCTNRVGVDGQRSLKFIHLLSFHARCSKSLSLTVGVSFPIFFEEATSMLLLHRKTDCSKNFEEQWSNYFAEQVLAEHFK